MEEEEDLNSGGSKWRRRSVSSHKCWMLVLRHAWCRVPSHMGLPCVNSPSSSHVLVQLHHPLPHLRGQTMLMCMVLVWLPVAALLDGLLAVAGSMICPLGSVQRRPALRQLRELPTWRSNTPE